MGQAVEAAGAVRLWGVMVAKMVADTTLGNRVGGVRAVAYERNEAISSR